MSPHLRFLRSACFFASCLAAIALAACAGSEPIGSSGSGGSSSPGNGGTTGGGATAGTEGPGIGGTMGDAGAIGSGGSIAGNSGSGGTGEAGRGGNVGSGGSVSGSGGTTTGRGGATGSGGSAAGSSGSGGSGVGGTTGRGGAVGSGGSVGRGGTIGTGGSGGTTARGGTTGTGGSGTGGSTGSGGATTVDCNATLPTGGTMHTGSTQGTAAGLSWSLWMNGSGGSLTTYSTPAFSAAFGPNSGDFLARMGLSFGNSGKAVSALGTVTAQYTETHTGDSTANNTYSYIGIYGWSINPCIEWYIVDDTWKSAPFSPGGTNEGQATIDGGTYNIVLRSTTGTGGNRCGSSVTQWNQYYSIRTAKRSCGTITITDHFAAWAAKNLPLGNVLEASILAEIGGGTGTVSFPVANVTQQ